MTISKSLLSLLQMSEGDSIKIETRALNASDIIEHFINNKIECDIKYQAKISEVENNRFTKHPFGIYRVEQKDIPKIYFLISPLQDTVQFGLHDDDDNMSHLLWDPKVETIKSFYDRELKHLFESNEI